jgi:hypothetical protein
MKGLLGVPTNFSKFFLNDVECTILGRSGRQRKANKKIFKEKKCLPHHLGSILEI